MPDPNDPKLGDDESINTVFQLVVKVATDAASSIASTSTTLANFEGRVAAVEKGLADVKTSIDNLKTAVDNHTATIKEKRQDEKENKKARWELMTKWVTPQAIMQIVQIIAIIGVGLGLWTQIPGGPTLPLPGPDTSVDTPEQPDPGTMNP